MKSPDNDNEMLQDLGINFVKGAQKDGDFLEKRFYRGLEKIEHTKKYSEGGHLSYRLQGNELVMNQIGSQKQVIAESKARSLLSVNQMRHELEACCKTDK